MEEDNLETYFLVWLDASVDSSEQKLTIQRKLRSSINYLKTFHNENQCEDYIRSTRHDDRIILIISGQLGRDLVHHIHHLRQISSIYVFCFDRKKYQSWANQYQKIKCVITQSDELISQIEYDQTRRNHIKIDEPLSISIFDEKSNKNCEDSKCSIDNQFVYSQLLVNSLLQMKTLVKDKNQFLNFCQRYFRQNEDLLLTIEEFEREYSSLKSLWWLTRNSFISRMITKAFRLKNFHILFLCRFFLQDIYRQLQLNKSSKPLRVYRTQLISNIEFQILENSIGKLLSINSFLLTNLVRKQALSFLKESSLPDDIHQILYEIDADPKLIGIKSFANITSLSYFIGEQQILFMPGSIYRLNHIRQEEKKLTIIQMTLCSNTEQEFQLIHDLEHCDLLSFGQILIEMRKFHEAEIYFNHLLHDLPSKHSDIPICYDALGNILLEKSQYNLSLKWYKKSLEIRVRTVGRDDPSIAAIHNHIASVHLKKNNSTQALESFQMALDIFQQKFEEKDPHIAECYNNMAMVYRNENKYEQALQCYRKTLSIHQKYLRNSHPDLAMSHTNMGMVYAHLKQYDLALDHYNEALKVYERILPLRHCLNSMIFENMGNIFYDKNEFHQGLLYYEKAAAIYRHLLPSTHPDVLQIGMVIGRIESKLKYM